MRRVLRLIPVLLVSLAVPGACRKAGSPTPAPASPSAPAAAPAHAQSPAPAPAADRKAAVEAALQKYGDFVAKMDDEGISEMYTTDGVMASSDGKPVVGRAAILRHLRKLHDFKVQSSVVGSESVTFEGEDALQKGTYRQTVRTPKGATIEASGKLEAVWTLEADGAWRLKKLTAFPDKPAKGATPKG